MDAIAPSLTWFHGGYELRELSRTVTAGPTTVKLWLGAGDRAEAMRAAAALELLASRGGSRARRVGQRRPITAVVPDVGADVPEELADLADRPWALIEGCLVQAVEDVDVIAAEWLELTGGNAARAEASINRIHLWDLLDDDEPGDARADLSAAAGLAHAWLPSLSRVAGAERIVVELRASGDGPELTVFRWDVSAASPSATTRAAGPRISPE